MLSKKVWARVLGIQRGVILEGVACEDDSNPGDGSGAVIVVSCRLRKGSAMRCGRCGRRCPGYDAGEGRRRWRALDAGCAKVFIEADAPRVRCPDHGVVVAAVPWARHGAGHTRMFDDQVAWLVTNWASPRFVEGC